MNPRLRRPRLGDRVWHIDGRPSGTVTKAWGAGGFEVTWDDGRVWTYRPETELVFVVRRKP